MTLQAINAQALRPAVNFKAQEAEAPVAAIKTADDSSAKAKHTTAKVLGGTAALAVLGFGIYKLAKGKGAKDAKKAAQDLFEKRHATVNKQSVKNQHAANVGQDIVKEYQAMQRRLTDHFPIQKELNEMNWDATPLKRADVIENLKKEAAEAAKKSADEFAAQMAKKA